MDHRPTIGLEIHAELNTRTKMFCDSLNDPEEKHPNTNVCPVCLGHPGALPVINRDAVVSVLRVGLALGGMIAAKTKFDRKNYFYPDLPKGYQISQYDEPLISGGELLGVSVRRIHLEEDTGTLVHDGKGASLVDYNRAGAPLMELVTEPDITSAEQAVAFAKEFQRIIRYLGVSNARMERGEMRVEVNISLNMGTKVELKNLNSFAVVGSAVAYEIERQAALLADGKEVKQETRGWDEAARKTVSQRSKEEAHDYRYFPEPDLPPFTTAPFDINALRNDIPELPLQKRARFMEEYGLSEAQADLLADDKRVSEYFESSASEYREFGGGDYGILFNYFTSDLWGLIKEAGIDIEALKVSPEQFAHLAGLAASKKITSRAAKDVLRKMFETGLDPEGIITSEGLETVVDAALLDGAVEKAIAANPKAVEDYRKGKTNVLQFLVGQAMKELRGASDPETLRALFEKILK